MAKVTIKNKESIIATSIKKIKTYIVSKKKVLIKRTK